MLPSILGWMAKKSFCIVVTRHVRGILGGPHLLLFTFSLSNKDSNVSRFNLCPGGLDLKSEVTCHIRHECTHTHTHRWQLAKMSQVQVSFPGNYPRQWLPVRRRGHYNCHTHLVINIGLLVAATQWCNTIPSNKLSTLHYLPNDGAMLVRLCSLGKTVAKLPSPVAILRWYSAARFLLVTFSSPSPAVVGFVMVDILWSVQMFPRQLDDCGERIPQSGFDGLSPK